MPAILAAWRWVLAIDPASLWGICYLPDGMFIRARRAREMRNGMLISVCSYGLTLFTVPILDNHGLWLEVTVFLIMRGVTLGAIW
ncbi:hypothetical protein [Erwinia tracheiphila]|uniref:hypothetical protein n=1 Tax=Erwinia tracheiphila TaxID=65700 RepID=UPI001910AE58